MSSALGVSWRGNAVPIIRTGNAYRSAALRMPLLRSEDRAGLASLKDKILSICRVVHLTGLMNLALMVQSGLTNL